MVFKKQILTALFIIAGLVGIAGFQMYRFDYFHEQVSVWVFDIGQGDAIFIDGKKDILIDGGPSNEVIEKLTMILPFWDRAIDLVINTHPHADHLTGLIHVLERYIVSKVWVSGQVYQTRFFDEFDDVIEHFSSVVFTYDRLELQEHVYIEVLWPMTNLEGVELEDPNDGSIVLLVECFDTRILLTGDIGVEQELAIMDDVGDIDVLKVSHQGSITSSHVDFLQNIHPEIAIISVGKNDYGHPHEQVLSRFIDIGAHIYQTDIHGDVRVICSQDGYEMKLY